MSAENKDTNITELQKIILELILLPYKIDSPPWLPQILKLLGDILSQLHQRNVQDYLNLLIPIKEISSKLGVSQRKLLDLRRRGEIEVVAIGGKLFVLQSQIDKFISEHTIHRHNEK